MTATDRLADTARRGTGCRAAALVGRSVARRLAVVLAVALTAALTACGGGTDRTKAQVRLVNAADTAGYPSLDMTVDGAVRQGTVTYGNTGSYVDVDPKKTATTISNSGSATALLSFTPSYSKDKHYTVLAFGGAGALRQVLLDENLGQPAVNRTSLQVINAAPDAGNLDIYITADADDITTAVAATAGAGYGVVSPVLDVASGTWRVRVAAANSKTDVRLDVHNVVLGNRQNATLVLTPSAGGALVNALLLVQEGDVARLDSPQARVRAVAGVANSGAVSATLGGTPLLAAIGSPAIGAYFLVPAGTQTPAVTVNGSVLPATAVTLAAGGDYSLLVYGALASPQTAMVVDNNRLPTVSGTVNVRLVNAVAGLPGNLSMTVDALPVAGNVAAGTASTPYVAVNATDVAAISVTAVGVATPVFSVSPQVLTAGGTYSVFVVGAAGATSAVVRKDR